MPPPTDDAGKDSEIYKMAKRALPITLLLALVFAAGALAAGPLNGKTYKTTTPSTGYNQRNQKAAINQVPMTLKVSGNGKTVTVHFASTEPLLYCGTKDLLEAQTTQPAKISHGSFTAKVGERFKPGIGEPPIIQVVTGSFSGHSVHGTIRTEAPPCGGYTTYSAKA